VKKIERNVVGGKKFEDNCIVNNRSRKSCIISVRLFCVRKEDCAFVNASDKPQLQLTDI